MRKSDRGETRKWCRMKEKTQEREGNKEERERGEKRQKIWSDKREKVIRKSGHFSPTLLGSDSPLPSLDTACLYVSMYQ